MRGTTVTEQEDDPLRGRRELWRLRREWIQPESHGFGARLRCFGAKKRCHSQRGESIAEARENLSPSQGQVFNSGSMVEVRHAIAFPSLAYILTYLDNADVETPWALESCTRVTRPIGHICVAAP